MALRVVLVCMVACLGFELPGSEDLGGWERSGRGWVAARMDDLASLRVEVGQALGWEESPQPIERVVTEPVEALSGRVDLAFEAVMEGMTAGFSADLAAARSTQPIVSELAATDSEPDEAPMATLATEVPAAPAPRLEKISTAVRLTRQALDAWASVIEPTADREPADPSVDSL